MNAVKAPHIQGVRDKTSDDIDVKIEKETTLEQVSEMDLVKPVPVDEVTDLADIATKPLEVSNQEAAVRVKNRITEKQEAALAKARQAKKEKKALAKLEGTDAAKGTPAPDLLVELNQKMEHFTQLLQDLKQKQDLIKYRGEASALQENHIVEPHKPKMIPDEVQEEERVLRPMHTTPETIPVNPPPPITRTTEGPVVSDAQTLTQRFKRSMESLTYQNEPMMKRARMDPVGMGNNYMPNSSGVIWF